MARLLVPYLPDILAGIHPVWREAIFKKDHPLHTSLNQALAALGITLSKYGTTPELLAKHGLVGIINPDGDKIFTSYQQDPTLIDVVICGQDPYPNAGVADGRSFSTQPENKIPASLLVIFKLLAANGLAKDLHNPNLEYWSRQGVWNINSYLTRNPFYHYENDALKITDNGAGKDKTPLHTFWSSFTINSIKYVIDIRPESSYLAILLWGAPAQAQLKEIVPHLTKLGYKEEKLSAWLSRYRLNTKIIDVMTWAHPSPANPNSNFSQCPHFLEIQKMRAGLLLKPIIWDTDFLPPIVIATDGNCAGNGTRRAKAMYGFHIPNQFVGRRLYFSDPITQSAELTPNEFVYDGILKPTETPAPITNNRAELLAAITALIYVLDKTSELPVMPPIRFVMDSTYVINAIHVRIWTRRVQYGANWLNKVKENKDLVKILAQLLARLAVRYGASSKSSQHQWQTLIHPDARVENAFELEFQEYVKWTRLLCWHQPSHTTLGQYVPQIRRECHRINQIVDQACK